MAALAGVTSGTFVAHGGVGGAVVEVLLVVGVAAFFLAIWWRERRNRDEAD